MVGGREGVGGVGERRGGGGRGGEGGLEGWLEGKMRVCYIERGCLYNEDVILREGVTCRGRVWSIERVCVSIRSVISLTGREKGAFRGEW